MRQSRLLISISPLLTQFNSDKSAVKRFIGARERKKKFLPRRVCSTAEGTSSYIYTSLDLFHVKLSSPSRHMSR